MCFGGCFCGQIALQGKENKMKAKHIDESRLEKTKQNGKIKPDETYLIFTKAVLL